MATKTRKYDGIVPATGPSWGSTCSPCFAFCPQMLFSFALAIDEGIFKWNELLILEYNLVLCCYYTLVAAGRQMPLTKEISDNVVFLTGKMILLSWNSISLNKMYVYLLINSMVYKWIFSGEQIMSLHHQHLMLRILSQIINIRNKSCQKNWTLNK